MARAKLKISFGDFGLLLTVLIPNVVEKYPKVRDKFKKIKEIDEDLASLLSSLEEIYKLVTT